MMFQDLAQPDTTTAVLGTLPSRSQALLFGNKPASERLYYLKKLRHLIVAYLDDQQKSSVRIQAKFRWKQLPPIS